jgi:hypothetical protein
MMLLEFVAMIVKVMRSDFVLIVEVLMLDQSDPHVLPHFCFP